MEEVGAVPRPGLHLHCAESRGGVSPPPVSYLLAVHLDLSSTDHEGTDRQTELELRGSGFWPSPPGLLWLTSCFVPRPVSSPAGGTRIEATSPPPTARSRGWRAPLSSHTILATVLCFLVKSNTGPAKAGLLWAASSVLSRAPHIGDRHATGNCSPHACARAHTHTHTHGRVCERASPLATYEAQHRLGQPGGPSYSSCCCSLRTSSPGSRELSQADPRMGKEKNVLEVSNGSLWMGVSRWLARRGVAQEERGPEMVREGNREGPKGGGGEEEQGDREKMGRRAGGQSGVVGGGGGEGRGRSEEVAGARQDTPRSRAGIPPLPTCSLAFLAPAGPPPCPP